MKGTLPQWYYLAALSILNFMSCNTVEQLWPGTCNGGNILWAFWEQKNVLIQHKTAASNSLSAKMLSQNSIFRDKVNNLTKISRSVVLGMGDGSMTTHTIADPEIPGIADFLNSLPSRWTQYLKYFDGKCFFRTLWPSFRNPEGSKSGERAGPYLQNGVEVSYQL